VILSAQHVSSSNPLSQSRQWTTPRLTLYASPRVKANQRYRTADHTSFGPARRPEWRSANKLMQVLAFNSRVVHRDCPGESRRGPKLVFFFVEGGWQRGQLEMDHTWCVVVPRTRPLLLLVFGGNSRLCPCSRRVSRRLDICCFSHLREMFCMFCIRLRNYLT